MDILASRLEVLLKEAEEQNLSLEKLPGWLKGWKSPWKGKLTGGELIVQGEDELYDFGIRTRERFPNLFDQDYHPDVYTIKATQVSFVVRIFQYFLLYNSIKLFFRYMCYFHDEPCFDGNFIMA